MGKPRIFSVRLVTACGCESIRPWHEHPGPIVEIPLLPRPRGLHEPPEDPVAMPIRRRRFEYDSTETEARGPILYLTYREKA